jgi:hypothetical protein
MSDINTNFTITTSGNENAEQAFQNINNKIIQSVDVTEDLAKSTGTLNGSLAKLPNTLSPINSQLDRTNKSMGGFNMVGMNFNRIIQDSPFFLSSFSMGMMSIQNNIGPLAESFAYAKKNGESFTSVLSSSLGGLNGYMMALNLAIAAITAFSIANRGAKGEVDSLNKSIEEQVKALVKVKDYQYEFLVNPEDVEIRIEQIDKLIKKYKEEAEYVSGGASARAGKGGALLGAFVNTFITKDLTATEEKRLETLDLIQEQLKKNKETLEAQLEIERTMEEIGVKKTLRNDKVVKPKKEAQSEFDYADAQKSIEKYYDMVEFTDDNYYQWKTQRIIQMGRVVIAQKQAEGAELINIEKAINKEIEDLNEKHFKFLKENATYAGVKIGKLMSPVSDKVEKPSFAVVDDLEIQKQQYKELNLMSMEAANTLRNGFMQVWQDIFGEANNLLTQFLQNVAAGIADLAAQKLASSIFSAFLGLFSGGASVGATAAAGFLGGPTNPNFSIGTTKPTIDNKPTVISNIEKSISNYKETFNIEKNNVYKETFNNKEQINNYKEIINNNEKIISSSKEKINSLRETINNNKDTINNFKEIIVNNRETVNNLKETVNNKESIQTYKQLINNKESNTFKEVANSFREKVIDRSREVVNNNFRESVNNNNNSYYRNEIQRPTEKSSKTETRIFNIQLGDKTLAKAVVTGQNIATSLRYA